MIMNLYYCLCTGKFPLKYNQLQVDWASIIGILDTAVDEVATKMEVCDYKIGDFVLKVYQVDWVSLGWMS